MLDWIAYQYQIQMRHNQKGTYGASYANLPLESTEQQEGSLWYNIKEKRRNDENESKLEAMEMLVRK